MSVVALEIRASEHSGERCWSIGKDGGWWWRCSDKGGGKVRVVMPYRCGGRLGEV